METTGGDKWKNAKEKQGDERLPFISGDELFDSDRVAKTGNVMTKIETKNVNCWYEFFHVLRDVSMEVNGPIPLPH